MSSFFVRFRFGMLVAVVALVCPRLAIAQVASMSEPAVKAGLLFNFGKFAEWPTDQLAPTAPMSVCVSDPAVASEFEAIATGKSIGQHAVKLSRVKLDESIRTCTILYVGKLDSKKQDQLITLLAGTSTLTVGDAEDFALRGGMIALYVDQGKMKFAVNRDAVQRTRITLSSQLLTFAKLVRNTP